MRHALLTLTVVLAGCSAPAVPSASAQSTGPCEDRNAWNSDHVRVCEERTFTLPSGSLALDASPNGGITVTAWSGDAIEVVAQVEAYAPTEAAAQRLVDGTQIETRGTVRAAHPDAPDDHWVVTSFRVRVPERTDLDLDAFNGGITVDGVRGDLDISTLNGGISLARVAGQVRAHTTNGGVSVTLADAGWTGEGLDVQTTNGGISLTLPPDYSADLVASTQMGSISAAGVSLAVERHEEGRWHGETLEGTLGRGGAPLRAVTTNGGVSIRQSR